MHHPLYKSYIKLNRVRSNSSNIFTFWCLFSLLNVCLLQNSTGMRVRVRAGIRRRAREARPGRSDSTAGMVPTGTVMRRFRRMRSWCSACTPILMWTGPAALFSGWTSGSSRRAAPIRSLERSSWMRVSFRRQMISLGCDCHSDIGT